MAVNNLNPGIGPTNADIAAAVAAPSAATIAAAVAAPSAATIASTVAAPSSATIASAVAAAVPTLSQINSSVASNAPSPNAWVFLGSGNLQNVSSATVSFSAYRKIRVFYNILTRTSSGEHQQICIRLNGDSNSFYSSMNITKRSGTGYNLLPFIRGNTRFFLTKDTASAQSNSTVMGEFEIDNAALTSTKIVRGTTYYRDVDSADNFTDILGTYTGASAITSFTFFANEGNAFANNTVNQTGIQIWGMN
jgi:hypothetical protein